MIAQTRNETVLLYYELKICESHKMGSQLCFIRIALDNSIDFGWRLSQTMEMKKKKRTMNIGNMAFHSLRLMCFAEIRSMKCFTNYHARFSIALGIPWQWILIANVNISFDTSSVRVNGLDAEHFSFELFQITGHEMRIQSERLKKTTSTYLFGKNLFVCKNERNIT